MDYEDETKTEKLVLWVGPRMKRDLEQRAARARRPMANLARLLLADALAGIVDPLLVGLVATEEAP